MNRLTVLFIPIFLNLLNSSTISATQYEPTWESMASYDAVPQWFQDAKFGIYFHWGPYAVPEFESEWYPRMIYTPGVAKEFHQKTYGDPNEFGYHDLIPLFKAENFDASEWATLFKDAGARFAGPVAEHHDGFSMWDSSANPWNAVDMGPKKDLVGELEKAIKGNGMKFITTFHHSRNFNRYTDPEVISEELNKAIAPEREYRRFSKSHYPMYEDALMPRTADPKLRILYGNMPEGEWCEQIWFPKLQEVIDQYQPDLIWFDSWLDLVPEDYRKQFCAYYLNAAKQWDKEVVIVRKQDDLPLDLSVKDFERSRSAEILDRVWMTDDTINTGKGWSYLKTLDVKPAHEVLNILIDIVSKNGVLLFNISPKADGTIPQDQKDMLLKVGDWLKKYGESIYATTPWEVYGEGPTRQPATGVHGWHLYRDVQYTSKDLRFTQNDEYLYVLMMGKPESGDRYLIQSFSKKYLPKNFNIQEMELMYCSDKLDWKLTKRGLELTIPNNVPDEMVQVLRIKK